MRDPQQPEPFHWQRTPTLRERVWRAISVPAVLGSVIFVCIVAGAIVLVALRNHEPSGQVQSAPSSAGESGNQGESAGSVPTATAPPDTLTVHVAGEVQHPGVVQLPRGARVEAALAAAGGATEAAVLSGVNLARLIVDGEQIVVPSTESVATSAVNESGLSGRLINLNSANQTLLESLPGIGPALAQRIVQWRGAHGPFVSVEQLLEVSGVGARTLESFREMVTV